MSDTKQQCPQCKGIVRLCIRCGKTSQMHQGQWCFPSEQNTMTYMPCSNPWHDSPVEGSGEPTDVNCFTLPNGDCVGGLMKGDKPCMHDALSAAGSGAREQAKAWAENLRESCHDNYNGGHHERETNDAFHHGMDTVCNVLAGRDGEDGALVRYAEHCTEQLTELRKRIETFKENEKALTAHGCRQTARAEAAERELSIEKQAHSTFEQIAKTNKHLLEAAERELKELRAYFKAEVLAATNQMATKFDAALRGKEGHKEE